MQFRVGALLGKSLAELDDMPLEEWFGWLAYWQLEPWGCAADDSRTEALLQVSCQLHVGRNSKIPDRFIDRDPDSTPQRRPRPNRKQLEENIREAFAGIRKTTVYAQTEQTDTPDK